ncbi:MAG: glycosyltransferase family 4 protein, partial [Acidimicrobiales bacterium]
MKILLGAFSCRPGGGGEDGAGWTFARAAALGHDVWLVTEAYNADVIEEALRREPALRLRPVYVEIARLRRIAPRNRLTQQIYYVIWQFRAARVARRLHDQIGFEVAHHVTLASDFLPMGVARQRDIPVVLGPIGGYGRVPRPLRRWLGWQGRLQRWVNDPVISAMRWVLVERAARRAAVIVTLNREVAGRFRRATRVVVEPNPAFVLDDLRVGQPPPRRERLALFAGRVVTWKGTLLAIAAIAQPAAAGWRLEMIGPGSEADLATIRRVAARLGVEDRVDIRGWMPRDELLAELRGAHCLLYPSLLDSGGWVLAEAMTLGTPVVGLDWLGVASIAGDVGYLVPPDRNAPRALARVLTRVPLGVDTSDRWDADRLPAFLNEIYEEAVTRRRSHL